MADGSITNNKLATTSVTYDKLDFGGSGHGIWWEEIGRTTLAGAGDTISVTSLPARKYLLLQVKLINSGTITAILRFNNDSTATYASRFTSNGAADTTAASATSIPIDTGAAYNIDFFASVVNETAREKGVFASVVSENTAGAGNIPGRIIMAAKWANTAAQISRVDIINTSTGDFAIGSEVVVLGHN